MLTVCDVASYYICILTMHECICVPPYIWLLLRNFVYGLSYFSLEFNLITACFGNELLNYDRETLKHILYLQVYIHNTMSVPYPLVFILICFPPTVGNG
jgi:hypothetical protein